jgi:uncharacterized iron-regulated membrane protein
MRSPIRHTGECCDQLRVVACVGFGLTRVARGVDAGRAVERIDADARVVGQSRQAREKARERVSDVKLSPSPAAWSEPVAKAIASAATRAPGAPVDRVVVDFKADPPTVIISLGKPTGGEDKKLVFNAATGEYIREESYEDKPFLTRLHSGEAFGDWGLLLGTTWGVALLVLLATGLVIYLAMRKPGQKGWRRLFW